ncbi:MAG TPA: NAD(P)H-dependent oxidoreductase subunit E [Vicinamibacterales bacterium]|nr:NAD(P)H-dependent oxidoreductase subunit E [Vicinamibacterales bacterium]
MDLHIIGGEPTDAERAAVDELLGAPESGWHGAARDIERDGRTASGGRAITGERHRLLPALHAVQDRIGWISRGALNYICRRLAVPPAEAWGVLTFYHLLGAAPRPPVVAHVCDDIACRLRGAEQLCRALEARLGPPLEGGHPSAAHEAPAGGGEASGVASSRAPAIAWQRSPCLGQCDAGSAALITRAGATVERFVFAPIPSAAALVDAMSAAPYEPGPRAIASAGAPKLLARMLKTDPTSLDSYRAHGGYRALARALELGPERVIEEVTASKLLGRGGAAFPTGRKWDAVRRQPAMPHYVVCNADESEPGTFKDRELMGSDPFAVVESMTICGLATGSTHGFIYVRGEYPLCEARLGGAIRAARAAGLLGDNVMGSGRAFDIEIRRGGGAYICGEETALFNSIEGKRGEPRSKPPFPAEVGVFGKPTVANNVETLVNVLDIVLEGGAAWATTGTTASTGTRLFCLSGHVERPGLYEVPFGTTLREVIELAGGVGGDRAVKAVLLGGAAGSFVTSAHLDMPLTFEAVRDAGTTLGSGVVMVFDETADIGDALQRMAAFFRDESCGQCVPCRVGTVRQQELLPALANGARGASSATYLELSAAMRDASICGLGQTASAAIESALKLGLIQEHARS